MDLSMLEVLIPNVAAWLNVDPATVLLYITLICTIANLIGRLIPDDAVGFLGRFRDVCKVLGVYTPNRVASGISVNDVARSIITTADNEVVEAAMEPDTLIPEVENRSSGSGGYRGSPGNIKESEGPVVPAFPGLNDPRVRDAQTGKFVSPSKGDSGVD